MAFTVATVAMRRWETGGTRTERTGVGRSAKIWRPSAVQSGRTRWGGAPRGPVALRSRCSDVTCLRGWRRDAEELGDHGFGGAQHRGDQRTQVEVALAGGAYDAGQDLLGVAQREKLISMSSWTY